MKLWTIQSLEFYNNLISEGEIYSSEEFAEPYFNNAYKWMINQMENRIGNRPNSNIYPIWAWYQFTNVKSKRPDLRTKGLLPKGTKGVRIEFDKPDNQILLSDFDLWHFPLNYLYIADSDKHAAEFDHLLTNAKVIFWEKEKYPTNLREILESSWDKIFDMSYDCEYVAEKFSDKKIQATFWNLKSSEITKVDFFNAK